MSLGALTGLFPIAELSNVEFRCGRAEDLLPTLVSRLASQQLVAVLDPPRAGLRECPGPGGEQALRGNAYWPTSPSSDSKVILAIRKAENLKRLLYVSCNPRAAMANFVE